jgi:hypothetical protein
MQTTMATKDEKPGASLNWRQRKKANMRQQQEAQRRQELVDGIVQKLGGIERVDALQRVEIGRVVDMALLAEGTRAKALRGEAIDIGDMVRLEGALSRVLRSLNLPAPNAAAAVPTLQDYLASKQAAEPEG